MIIKLKTVGNGPYIEAPPFCPYKTDDTVHSSICQLCKICEFTTYEVEKEGISDTEKHSFIDYLTSFNSKIAASIAGQHKFLTKNNRLPIAVLISSHLLDQALQYVCREDAGRLQPLLNYIIAAQTPICFILGCPVYLALKLTKSPILVIGETFWK